MKALTLRHPWPFAVCFLNKRVENREWDQRLEELFGVRHLVGEVVAIHGGAAPTRPLRRKLESLSPKNPWREFTADLGHIRANILGGELPDEAAQYLARTCPGGLTPECFILPGIVAVATVSGTSRASRDRWAAQGCLHILLDQVITLPEPVECRGAQGLWEVPEVIEQEVTRRYRAVLNTRPPVSAEQTGAEWLGI